MGDKISLILDHPEYVNICLHYTLHLVNMVNVMKWVNIDIGLMAV